MRTLWLLTVLVLFASCVVVSIKQEVPHPPADTTRADSSTSGGYMPKPEGKPGATPGGPGTPATPPGREENPGKGHDKEKPEKPTDPNDLPHPEHPIVVPEESSRR